MFIFTTKVTKKKVIAAVVILAAIICIIILAAGAGDNNQTDAFAEGISAKNIKTNEDRVDFLNSLGWEVKHEIIEVKEAVIPKEFNDTYNAYNKIQMEQGCDLSNYAGQRVKRYTYIVTNYPETGQEVHANLLVYKNTVIGGDISSSGLNGFMHALVIK